MPDLPSAASFILDQYPKLLAQCSRLAEGIAEGSLVLIGGQSRSGKSTYASVLRDAIRAGGRDALVLSTDRWLRPHAERAAGVEGRYDMPALRALLDSLADRARRPQSFALPGYHKVKRERVEAVETVTLSSADVVLIEGTVALLIGGPHAAAALRLHVAVEEDARKRRVLREYRLRGYPDAQALEVYAGRRDDEFPAIEAAAAAAGAIRLAAEAA